MSGIAARTPVRFSAENLPHGTHPAALPMVAGAARSDKEFRTVFRRVRDGIRTRIESFPEEE